MKIIELITKCIDFAEHKDGFEYGQRKIRKNKLLIVDEELKGDEPTHPYRLLLDESPVKRVEELFVDPEDFENPGFAHYHNLAIGVLSYNSYERQKETELSAVEKSELEVWVARLRAQGKELLNDKNFIKIEEVITTEEIIVQDFWNW